MARFARSAVTAVVLAVVVTTLLAAAAATAASAAEEQQPQTKKKKKAAAVGIDLGTTFSCVGVYEEKTVTIVPNDQGNRITPSWLAFSADGERLVGESAKNQAAQNAENTVYDVKRLIGRTWEDVQGQLHHFPFSVVNEGGRPRIRMRRGKEEMTFAPEEISAMVLQHLKAFTEEYLNAEVKDVVVTVPAYFNDAQRQATRDAGHIAGLNVMRVLNEPTAAAIAYGLDRKISGGKQILVFDLGGGTFDVSLLKIDRGDFTVLATSGDTRLGGSDFDEHIMDYLMDRFKMKNGEKFDLRGDSRALAKLRREAEKAKRLLSSAPQARVEIESIMGGRDLRETITRAKFEEMLKVNDISKRVTAPIQKVLDDAELLPRHVHSIVLVGGSTRIPYIRMLVQAMFAGREPETGVNPDEAVAWGAAVQAGVLSGAKMSHRVTLHDVTPLSLGIRTAGGMMSNIIDRNTRTPAKREKDFTTSKNNQRRVTIEIFEGERALVEDNHFLGKFDLNDIPPGPRGSQKFKVTFSIDEDGILNVSAYHIGHGSIQATMTIDGDTGRLTEEDIQEMIATAESNRARDRAIKESMDARSGLENYAFQLKNHLADPKFEDDNMADIDGELKRLQQAIADTAAWVEEHREEPKAVYDERRAWLDELAHPVLEYLRELQEAKEAQAAAEEEEARRQQEEQQQQGGGEGEGDGGDGDGDEAPKKKKKKKQQRRADDEF